MVDRTHEQQDRCTTRGDRRKMSDMQWCLGLLCVGVVLASDASVTMAGLRIMPERWNKAANLAKFERYVRAAAARGAQVAIAPEGFLEGYVGNVKDNPEVTNDKYLAIAETLDGASLTRVRSLARELRMYLGLGFAEKRGAHLYNSMAVFSPEGQAALHYSKAHNDDDEPFNTLGNEFPIASTSFGRWGALICYDRQLPETARILSIKGAQIILVPAWGEHGDMNDAMMRTRAFENSVWVVFVHPERCLFIDPRGTIVAQDHGGTDQVVTARIQIDARIGKGAIRSRRPEIYDEILWRNR
jgi:predicted amidohydrolase